MHMKKLEPEWVQEFLRKRGREITLEEATIIYEFMRKLAKIAVSQYLADRQSEEISQLKIC